MSEEHKNEELNLQQAVVLAMTTVQELYSAQGHALDDLLLEEITREGDNWLVTVGFTRPAPFASSLGQALAAGSKRAFKRVKLNAKTGEFLGMEIREMQSTNPKR